MIKQLYKIFIKFNFIHEKMLNRMVSIVCVRHEPITVSAVIDKLYTQMGKVFIVFLENWTFLVSCFGLSALYLCIYCLRQWKVRFNLREDASAPSLYPSCYIIYLCRKLNVKKSSIYNKNKSNNHLLYRTIHSTLDTLNEKWFTGSAEKQNKIQYYWENTVWNVAFLKTNC